MQQSLFALQPSAVTTVSEPKHLELNQVLLSDVTFTVIDLETTGLSAKRNAITEVTAIQYQNGNEIAKYSTLVKPTEAISQEVEQITGITNEMVQHAPPLVTVMSELAGFLGPSPILVGHNVAFDITFLQEKFQATGLSVFEDRVKLETALCTRVLALKLLPGLPSYEGIVVATQCGVINPNPHRAENDVRMSAGILFHLLTRLQTEQPDIRTVQDLLTFQGLLN